MHSCARFMEGPRSQQDFESLGRRSGLPVDRAEEHLNRTVGPAVVGMPDNIRQRFVNSASDRAAIWRGKSERFRQSFHRSAYRTKQTGIARQLQPQQQAAAQVPVALSGFAAPRWMEDFHVKLNFSPALIRLQSKHLSCSDLRSANTSQKTSAALNVPRKAMPACNALRRGPKSAADSKCSRKATPSSHGEQMRNGGSSGLG